MASVDTDGQKRTRFDSGGSIGGILGTDQNFIVPTGLVHIVIFLIFPFQGTNFLLSDGG